MTDVIEKCRDQFALFLIQVARRLVTRCGVEEDLHNAIAGLNVILAKR